MPIAGRHPPGDRGRSIGAVCDLFGTPPLVRRTIAEFVRCGKIYGAVAPRLSVGSFVTSKESPNDLDILLVMTGDFTVDALPEKSRVLFHYTDARLRFHADVFWTKASVDVGILAIWLDTYQVGKDFKRRGIVEIRLS